MTVKFSLKAAPTFKKIVDLPVHGSGFAPVEFEFKHRTKDELNAWLEGIETKSDADVLVDCVAGWDLKDKCTAASFELLIQNYAGSGKVIVQGYIDEILQARRKN